MCSKLSLQKQRCLVHASLVVGCSVFLQDNKNSQSLWVTDFPCWTMTFSDRLNVFTRRSASPFEDGWYDEHLMFYPIRFHKIWIFSGGKLRAIVCNYLLRQAICCKPFPQFLDGLLEVVLDSSIILGHFACTSVATMNILWKNDPTKSTWMYSHRCFGHNHGC